MTIALLAACSLAVGLSTVWPAAVYAAVPLFVLGLLVLIAGIALAMLELRYAVDPVEIESPSSDNWRTTSRPAVRGRMTTGRPASAPGVLTSRPPSAHTARRSTD
jgi:hypothetical protein